MSLPPPSDDSLARSTADWEVFAQEDPFWAILTDPAKQGGRWTLDEFLATGEGDVTRLIKALERLREPVARDNALDFGCGVGRVACPLTRRFGHVTGIDAAPSMIARAEKLNQTPERLTFVQSAEQNLPFRDACFDVVHSYLVLQHIPIDSALGYVREFIRVLRPRGVTYFVIPARFSQAAGRQMSETRFTFGSREAHMQMHCVPISEVVATIEQTGALIEFIETEQHSDHVLQTTYVVRRP